MTQIRRPPLILLRVAGLLALLCSCSSLIYADDEQVQYPRFLSNSYVGIDFGFLDIPFSNAQIVSGFRAETVGQPHLAVRALLFGHEFNEHFSAQVTYLRPVRWASYGNVNADGSSHSVWMNVGGLTAKARFPIERRLSAYGEGGLALITRKGFDIDGTPVVRDAEYPSLLLGAGVIYKLNSNWNLDAGATMSPPHHGDTQPSTSFFSVGFTYTMRPLSEEDVVRNADPTVVFPKNSVQLGYVTNALGYGVNNFFSKDAIRIFWSADVQAGHGFSVDYTRNSFHTRHVFSLDWGAGIHWLTGRRTGESFLGASVYPLFRFTLLRTKPADFYFDYSVAGPTFVSSATIDGTETGRRFTFQDFMGAGVFMDRKRHLMAELRILHYSNGNLFPRNPGVTVPLGFNLGYTF